MCKTSRRRRIPCGIFQYSRRSQISDCEQRMRAIPLIALRVNDRDESGADHQSAVRIGSTKARKCASTSAGVNGASLSTHQFSTSTNVAAM